jgi:hypothetical protein
MCSAKLNDVSHAFLGAVHAVDAVVVGWSGILLGDGRQPEGNCNLRANVRESEVYFVVHSHHGWQNHLLEAVLLMLEVHVRSAC